MYENLDSRTCFHQHGTMHPHNILGNLGREQMVDEHHLTHIHDHCNHCHDAHGHHHMHPEHMYHHHCGIHDCDNTVYQTSSQAATYNFTIQKGTTIDFDIVYKDASKCGVNLTGYTARFLAQYNDHTFTMNVKVVEPLHGLLKLFMSAYESSKIYTLSSKYSETTDYTYQLDLISPSKNVYRILVGTVTVTPAVGC